VAHNVLADAEARVPDAERRLDALLATVEERERELRIQQQVLEERSIDLDSLDARLTAQNQVQSAREAELKRREKDAEREGRKQARAHLMEARQLVENALAMARGAVDEAAAREARRLVEEGIREEGEALERTEKTEGPEKAESFQAGDRVKLPEGPVGQVMEVRADGKLVVAAGAVRMVVEPAGLHAVPASASAARSAASGGPTSPSSSSPLEIDLRGMTGDEAETATIAAVDAAVLAEQPFLRIIHGMGTGVVRERVRRVISRDGRISKYAFAPRSQGGTGVTIVEFSA
jgi:DNA mismatch repair protein MutS2